ncbi:putative ATPase [Halobacteroides halobius DSM 5150]|uniref:Putative ATPase n=1 Tax=Halobacteroides halobius (strain ATCC 35273 / DSM 5150 / MD-1) TaxID=748449 RepID=L0K4Z4_HALHC|nr:ATP-binding protein [Halobacteroides halobius]AGB40091.1 putative ATPase [Halobacteroides halobius DSM 5150]
MQVVGLTNQQEVYVASKEHKFRINEMLKIMDGTLDNPLGEVIETQSYNRYIPLSIDNSFVDQGVIDSLESIGYNIAEDEINIAKVRLLEEAPYPIQTGSIVETPEFSEVKELLIKEEPQDGLVLGVIKGTEELATGMDNNLEGIAPLLEGDEVVEQQGVPFNFKVKAMHQYPHVGIIGGSGSGKSFGMRVILEEMMKLEIPTIVFDPHFEMDFSNPFPGLDNKDQSEFDSKFVQYQIGYDVGVNFEDLSTKDLLDLLAAADSLTNSMVNAVQKLHQKNDSLLSFKGRLDDLKTAQEIGKKRIERDLKNGAVSGIKKQEYEAYQELLDAYGDLPASSVNGLSWRLGRLEREGLFSQSIDQIEAAIRGRKLVVIQGPIWLLQVFATYVLGTLYRKRRDYKDAQYRQQTADYFPPFVIATDEAHNFAPKGQDAPANKIIKEISQEGRKYGTFLILATQRPTLLNETVTAQLNTKFVFRTVRATDIETIKQETDLTAEEAKRLPYLRSGDTFVSSAIFGRTLSVRIRVAKTTSPHTENPFDELEAKTKEKDDELYQAIFNSLPIDSINILSKLEEINEQLPTTLDRENLLEQLDKLAEKGRVEKKASPLGDQIYQRACE